MIPLGNDEYLAISDDRSERGPARMVRLRITYENQKLQVEPLENIFLTVNGKTFAKNEVDGEAIAKLGEHVIIASEGSYHMGLRIAPFVRLFTRDGKQIKDIDLDRSVYIPEEHGSITKGVRSNLAFEAVATSPAQTKLFIATEAALYQDAPSNYAAQNIVRIQERDLKSDKLLEHRIQLDHIEVDAAGGRLSADNGLSDMLALSDHELLLLERAWLSAVKKQFIRIYYLDLAQKPLNKRLVLDMETLKTPLDNMEIICPGPVVAGRQTLIIASDNNFSRSQSNLFYLFALENLPK